MEVRWSQVRVERQCAFKSGQRFRCSCFIVLLEHDNTRSILQPGLLRLKSMLAHFGHTRAPALREGPSHSKKELIWQAFGELQTAGSREMSIN